MDMSMWWKRRWNTEWTCLVLVTSPSSGKECNEEEH